MTSISSSVSPAISFSPLNGATSQRTRDGIDSIAVAKASETAGQAGQVTEAASSSSSSAYTPSQADQQEQRQLAKLAARDREVRAHEAAHASVGGVYAGAPSYAYQRGPDGKNYAVGGEVSIDASPVAGDPQATIIKAQIVRRAALAPAEPSLQDRAVASEALAMEQNARRELLQMNAEEYAQAPQQARPQVQQGEQFTQAVAAVTGAAAARPGALLDTKV